jgi:hypothetical protein
MAEEAEECPWCKDLEKDLEHLHMMYIQLEMENDKLADQLREATHGCAD